MKCVSWVWRSLGVFWVCSSGRSFGVPGRVAVFGARLIVGSGLIGVGALVGRWGSLQLNVLSVSWVWISHSISWLCGSGRGDGVPSRVTSGRASFIGGSSLVGVSADVSFWKGIILKSKLDVLGMSWVWISHSINWLCSS